MRQYRRCLSILFLLSLLLTACNAAKSAPVPPAPTQAKPAAALETDAAVLPDSAQMFPAQDWAYDNDFDDGTKYGVEWWVRDGSRVVVADKAGVYAVWHIAPGGIYRRDPLGGPHAPLLQYLPATLHDNMAWQQSSGSEVVQFWLRRTATCGEQGIIKAGTPCWDLTILNRGRLQRFFFAEGAGVVAASLLAPASPDISYHKWATGRSSEPAAPSRKALLAQADEHGRFAAGDIAPPGELTPYQFLTHARALLRPALTTVPMNGPSPVYLLGALGAAVSRPAPILLDPDGDQWQRSQILQTPCTYQAQQQPVNHLLEICGRSTTSATDMSGTMRVGGWYRPAADLVTITWPGQSAVDFAKKGMQITAAADGRVTIQRAVGDPLKHVETIIYTLEGPHFSEANDEQLDLSAAGMIYPAKPEDVILAAFFARWHNLKAEVPLFFATASAADRLLRLDLPRAVGYGSHGEVQIGQLTRLAVTSAQVRAVKVTPTALVADQSLDFALETHGCCDSFQIFWGKVQFHQDSATHWQMTQLDVLFIQDHNGVNPLAQPR